MTIIGSAPTGLVTLQGTRELAGQMFADFSGGLIAVGSAYYGETPEWQSVAPFSIGTTTIPESLYEEHRGSTLNSGHLSPNHKSSKTTPSSASDCLVALSSVES